MMGAKCEAENITSVVIFLNDQGECIFILLILDLDFCLEWLTAFNVVS